ncbi:MAG: hypothetical protein ACP5VS_03770 [Desulfomonilaceae bacterium]
MTENKLQEKDDKSDCNRNVTFNKIEDQEKLTSIVQIDDSELPQSIKDKFKD